MASSIAELFIVIGARTGEFNKALDGVQNRLDKFGKQSKIIGGALVAMTAAVGGASLKLAADFDSAMREVNTMMLLSEEEFASFKDEVQALAKEMGVSAVEAANALYQTISAGVPKENAINFLRIATKAAIGGITDTVTAVDGLTTVLNAFKIPVTDAERVADIFFTTVKNGKVTFEELSASIFNVAPIAASLGVEFDTVAAALATMTKQGVPAAQATTQLRQAMVALTKPTTDMQAVIEDLGYESGQAMLQELGFVETINRLTEAVKGDNEQLMRMFGSVEAGNAILALTGQNAETFAADIAAMGNSAGAATDAFEQMEQTTSRKFAKLKQSIQDIGITIGEALMPVLQRIVDSITPIIKAIGDWIQKHPKLTTAILATTGALGGMLMILPQLVTAFKLVTAAFMAHPFALIAGIIAAVAIPAFFKLRDAVGGVEREVTQDFKDMRDEAQEKFDDMALETEASFRAMAAAGKDYTDDMKENVVNNFDDMFQSVDEILKQRRDSYVMLLTEMFREGTIGTEEELEKQIGAVYTFYDGLINKFQGMQGELAAAIEAQDWGRVTDIYVELDKEGTAVITAGQADKVAAVQGGSKKLTELTTDQWAQIVATTEKGTKEEVDAIRKAAQTNLETLKEQLGLGAIPEDVYAGQMAAIEAKRDLDIQAIYDAAEAEGIGLAKRKSLWEDFVADVQALWNSLEFNWPFGGAAVAPMAGTKKMAKGGLITEPTFLYGMRSGQTAIAGESGIEAIAPVGGMQGKTEIHAHLHVGAMMGNEMDARQFTRLVHRLLREEVATRTVGITV